MKLVCCAVLLACLVGVRAQFDAAEDAGPFPDYWQKDYDNFYDYPEENNDGAVEIKESGDAKQEDSDKLVAAEIQDFREQNEAQIELADDDSFDALVDYQFEDNRSDDDKAPAKVEDNIPNEEPLPDDAPELSADDLAVPVEPNEENNEDDEVAMDDEMWGDVFDEDSLEDIAPLPVPSVNEEPLKEEQAVVDQEIENYNAVPAKEASEESSIKQSDLEEIIVEAKQPSKESGFDEPDYDLNEEADPDQKSFEEWYAANNNDDETPEKVLDDLNSDLDKLFETLDKLSDDDESDLGENDGNVDTNDEVNEVQDYEEKYDRPYKEGNILSLRDDYDNFDDNNDGDLTENADDTFADDKPTQDEDVAEEEIAAVDENNNESSTTEAVEEQENVNASVENSDESFEYSDELDKLLDTSDENDDKFDELFNNLWRQTYGNDGLVDDQHELNKDAEMLSTTQADSTPEATTTSATESEEPRSTIMVENLNSEEYNDLMSQFAIAHSDDIHMNADSVAPVHITLSVDEPTVITSPNYPSAYPVNNVVDWIIESPGTGIEMNLTDFYVNGAMGHYLLVKPGRVDASGTDGLIFSYRLTHERRYRFTNVNRMFVRFEANGGMQFATGFSFSARMIWPLPEINREDTPEAEAVLHPPQETLILSLAGLTLPQFNEARSVFKELIADMAQEYITDNQIDPGLNTTLEVTQIMKTAVCNIRWPNYETCVEVTFGVPLHYEEEVERPRLTSEDLDAMWQTYIVTEPFATRLREMGITEYAIPDDRTVLMLWLVIALGVVIAMAMLAFALWRFRCFEDYTRMMAYNDTDSIQKEKKNLDLYPTPHQTLPPLYSDNDYKWADDKYDDSTRVDMGGFANKSYVRDDLFDFDSDEDIITPRDRKGVNSPRDVYEV